MQIGDENTLIMCGTSGWCRNYQFLLNGEYVNFNGACCRAQIIVRWKKESKFSCFVTI